MADDNIDEVSASTRDGRTLLRWKYPNGPDHYRWFNW